MEGLSELIASVGFPIAVTAFLLMRLEKRLDNLNDNLVDLAEILLKNKK